MGAVAISKEEAHRIDRLRKELRITTKSGLIREALKALEMKTRKERLRSEIQESVRCCAAADREENRELVLAGVGLGGPLKDLDGHLNQSIDPG